MFCGMFLSTIGTSMIWPFLMIYVSEKLDQPLTAVAFLLTINSATSLIAAFIAGPITDRLGRKWILIISLIGNGVVYLLMGQAITLAHFALLMVFRGLFTPLYRVGGDAMLADLVEPKQRPDAYALLRMSNNVGISIGPAVGGFIATSSYHIAFICAAVGLSSYGLLQGLTGVRYDARTKTLYVDSKIGDFRSFLSTATGFGVVELKNGKVSVDVRHGSIPVKNVVVGSKK